MRDEDYNVANLIPPDPHNPPELRQCFRDNPLDDKQIAAAFSALHDALIPHVEHVLPTHDGAPFPLRN